MLALTGCIVSQNPAPKQGSKEPSMEAVVTKVFTTGSYDGSTLLVVNLNVKNNSDVVLPAIVIQMYATATLDGKTLPNAYLPNDNPNALNSSASINSRSEGPAQLVFELTSTKGTVDLAISVETLDYSSTVEILKESINLASVEAIVSESEYEVVINKATVTDDGEGKDLIVLNITFTNNSDSAKSFGSAVGTELFQNDIALKSGYLPYNHPLADSDLRSNSYTDIRKGASIDLQVVYELYDTTNPVDIMCVDSRSYDRAVILEKTIKLTDASGSRAV